MNQKLLYLIGISLFLSGCNTTSGSSDGPPVVVLTAQEEAAMRQQMAVRLESSITAYAVIAPPAFKSATISAPYETNALLKGRVTRYCVNAVMDTALMSTSLAATITVHDTAQNGSGKRHFELHASRGNVPDCRMNDPKPYTELIQLREKRRAQMEVDAAANPPGFRPR